MGKRGAWKWPAIAVLVILLGLLGAWLIWSRVAAARLQQEVDRIRANHEPLLTTDFREPFVPDAKNAAVPLAKALSAFSTLS